MKKFLKKFSHQKKVTVVGCGKLGLPLVAVLANAGHQVKGFDSDSSLVSKLSSGHVPWFEESLQHLITANLKRIQFLDDPLLAFAESEFFLVIVPSPSDSNGVFESKFVESALSAILSNRRINTRARTKIIIVSTLMPGATDEIRKRLESVFGEKMNNFDIIYSPEFIALGSVVKDMTNPDLVLIGAYNATSAKEYQDLVWSYVKTKPIFAFLSPKEAEIAKIAVNSYVTTKISFANFVSELSDASGNVSASKILESIGADSRIGKRYLKPGAPFGGPCFPRDNVALERFASSVGVDASLAISTREINQRQVIRIAKFIEQRSKIRDVVLVGVAYKPGTAVYEESASIALASKLQSGRNVTLLDDYITTEKTPTGAKFVTRESLGRNARCVVLMVPDAKYSDIPRLLNNESIVIDLWGIWEKEVSRLGLRYFRLGDSIE